MLNQYLKLARTLGVRESDTGGQVVLEEDYPEMPKQ